MTRYLVLVVAVAALFGAGGCSRPDQTVVQPTMSAEEAQKQYDNYDQQMAEAARNP